MGWGRIKVFMRRMRDEGPRYVLRYETEREADGRYLADVVDLPGVMAYGETEAQAINAAAALALRVIAERIEVGETPVEAGAVFSFQHV